MEVVILGSGPGLPQIDRNLSSLLVRNNGTAILIDCGDGCSRKLLEMGMPADELDAIFITHYHPDHIGGVFILLQMLYLQGRTKPLKLFLPERPDAFMQILQLMYTFPERFSFALQILEMETCTQLYPWITAMANDHLQGYAEIIQKQGLPNEMRSWSLRFDDPRGALVYTSDISTTKAISTLLKDAHTAIVDAGHPHVEQLLGLPALGIKRIILTHGKSESLIAREHELDPDKFSTATENFPYQI